MGASRMKSMLKWVLILAAIVAVGPAVGALVGGLRLEADGSRATLLTGGVGGGLLALIALGFGAAALGAVMSRWLNQADGMNVAGLVAAWGAWCQGDADRIIHAAGSGVLWRWPVEGLMAAAIGIAIFIIIDTCASERSREPGSVVRAVASKSGLIAIVAAAVVGAAAAWIVGFQALRGQAIFAAIAGGIAGGAAACLAGAATAREARATGSIGLLALAVIGPLAAALVHGDRAAEAADAGRLIPLAVILPLDWVAGALLGVPVGVQWAHSMIEKRAAKTA